MTMVTERQRRWLTAVLVLGDVRPRDRPRSSLVGSIFFAFGDIILVFFLAWLLAFILSPLVGGLTRLVPVLPRVGAVVLVYAALVGAIVLVVVLVAGALAQSIADFIASVPTLRDDLPGLSQPWQDRLDALGLGQVDLAAQATQLPRQPRRLRDPAGRSRPAARRREPRGDGQPPDRPDPVALHGHRPRRDPVVPLPARAAGATRKRPASSRRASPARSAASSAARRSSASSTRRSPPSRARSSGFPTSRSRRRSRAA